MPRRTPILAIILAPIALILLVQLWNHALVPLYLGARYSDPVLQWRLEGRNPATRLAALKDLGSPRAADSELFDRLVVIMQTDDSQAVRETAATALGSRGAQHKLTEADVRALGELVLHEQDRKMLSAAVRAVGMAVQTNEFPDEVVARIAGILEEQEYYGLYGYAISAVGQVGRYQGLPEAVVVAMNTKFATTDRPGEREDIANAFVEMSNGRSLPGSTLDLLANVFATETNYRIRRSIVYALARSAADYMPAEEFVRAATRDPHRDVAAAAEHGLRIIEGERRYGETTPLSLALNTTRRTEERLEALRIIRGKRIEAAAYEQLVSLARDHDAEVSAEAVDMFRYMARSPDGGFERLVLIPELGRAMSAADPRVRQAAFGVLSGMSRNRPAWLDAADFPAQLETGAADPDPRVRVIVLVVLAREARGSAERDAIIERGLTDEDPYVRSNVISWLGSPRTKVRQRDALIARALDDPDPNVRRAAESAGQQWATRDRAWPVEAWSMLWSGEVRKVGMQVLFGVTVGTPVLIFIVFLVYFMARLLTYLQQRRRRAAAVIPVMAAWALATYGMFMLYFVAGMAGNISTGETFALAGILWAAIAVYAALGWGMHYAVRR